MGTSGTPVNVSLPAGTKVTAVAAGALHSLALTSTGAVLAWGYNADGELGDGSRTNSDVPVKVKLPAGTKVTAVAAGGYDSLALTSTGAVLAWGYNADGELGDGGTAEQRCAGEGEAVPVEGDRNRRRRPPRRRGLDRPGPGHSLAVTSNGAVFAWGYNADGELGNGSTTNEPRAGEGEAARSREGDRRRRRPNTAAWR